MIFRLAALLVLFSTSAMAETILVQSTTSTANSGFYDHVLPLFEKASGTRVNVVAVGTGQAIRNARNCDADVLLVHARAAEEAFVADGFGVERLDLMANDFVLVGPPDDPADVANATDATDALERIARAKAAFASRGDDSGTHKKERALWSETGIDPTAASGTWYRETGSGMGATLNIAVGMNAYALTDRATWTTFANRQDHMILSEGDAALFNPYSVIVVNPERCPEAKVDAAQGFADWLLSAEGQSAIAGLTIEGQQLFFPAGAK